MEVVGLLAHFGSAERQRRCLLLVLVQTEYAHDEPFSFWTHSGHSLFNFAVMHKAIFGPKTW